MTMVSPGDYPSSCQVKEQLVELPPLAERFLRQWDHCGMLMPEPPS